MNPILLMFLILAIVAGIGGLVTKARNEKRDNSQDALQAEQAAEGRIAEALQPGETILAMSTIDNKYRYYCAATEYRLIIEDKDGLHPVPYSQITKFTMEDQGTRKTEYPEQCFRATIKADKKYTIYNYSNKLASVMAVVKRNVG